MATQTLVGMRRRDYLKHMVRGRERNRKRLGLKRRYKSLSYRLQNKTPGRRTGSR